MVRGSVRARTSWTRVSITLVRYAIRGEVRANGVRQRHEYMEFLAPRARFELATLRLIDESVKNISALSGVAYKKIGAILPTLFAPNPAQSLCLIQPSFNPPNSLHQRYNVCTVIYASRQACGVVFPTLNFLLQSDATALRSAPASISSFQSEFSPTPAGTKILGHLKFI
jgi:hypothetical protein